MRLTWFPGTHSLHYDPSSPATCGAPPLDWITDAIAIGNHAEAHDAGFVRRHGFRSVLSLDGSMLEADPKSIGVVVIRAFDLEDGEGNEPGILGRVVAALEDLARHHAPVLVHCHAGRSRSVVVVAGYLVRTLGLTPDQAITRVAERRVICVTPEFEALLYEPGLGFDAAR